MPKEPEPAQGKLFEKKSKIVEIRPQDRKTGQHKLFGVVEEFAPGFQEWGEMMTERLIKSEEKNEILVDKLGQSVEQSKRLANSLEQVIPKFISIAVDNKNPDLLLSAYHDGDKADVAFASSALPSETTYPYVTADLAQLIGMHHSRLGYLFKKSGIFGDVTFHNSVRTGQKTFSQHYKITALNELYKRAIEQKVQDLNYKELSKLENYLRMKESQV